MSLLLNQDTSWRWVVRDVQSGELTEYQVCFWVLAQGAAKGQWGILPIVHKDGDLTYIPGGKIKRLPRE